MSRKLLILLLVSLTLSAVAYAAIPSGRSQTLPAAGHFEGMPANPGFLPAGAVEKVDARTQDSKTYDLPNGQRLTIVSQSPLHYKAADGSWADIDSTLLPTANGFEDAKNLMRTTVGLDGSVTIVAPLGSLAQAPLQMATRTSAGVVLGSIPAAAPVVSVSGAVATAAGLYPSGNGLTTVERGVVRHDLVLAAAPALQHPAGSVLAVEETLTVPAGLLPYAEGKLQVADFVTSGGIVFKTADGKEAFTILPATARDASVATGLVDPQNPGFVTAQLRLTHALTGYVLSTEIPADWLYASGRAFPVTIDPDTALYSDVYEAIGLVQHHQLLGNLGCPQAQCNYIEVGDDQDDSAYSFSCFCYPDTQYRTILRESLAPPSIPNTAYKINYVKSWYNQNLQSGNVGTINLYFDSVDSWDPNLVNWGNQPTTSTLLGSYTHNTGNQQNWWEFADWSSTGVTTLQGEVNSLYDSSTFMKGDNQISYTMKAAQEGRVDSNDWVSYWRTGSGAPLIEIGYSYDSTAPTTQSSIASGASQINAPWYVSTAPQVILSCSDSESGCSQTQYSLNGGSWTTYSGQFSVTAQGTNTILYKSKDHIGNWESQKSMTVQWDNVAPVTTLSLSGTLGSNSWYTSSVTATLSASDATSGVKTITYTLDGGAATTYTTPITIGSDGTHTLQYWSSDNAGNFDSTRTATIKVDRTAPTASQTNSCAVGYFGTWCRGSVSLTGSASDATSGVASGSPVCKLDNVAVSCSTSASSEGSHTWTVTATDNAGLSSTPASASFGVDTVAPSTTNSVGSGAVLGSNGWYRSSVVITLAGSDATSGVMKTMYQLNGGAWTQYSSPITISGQGTNTLNYYSLDNANNQESQKTASFKIDTGNPSTTASPSGTVGSAGWYHSAVTVTLAASDATSGVSGTFYRIAGGSQQTYATPFSVSAEGTTNVDYWSTDQAGNTESTHTLPVKIDTVPPTTAITLGGTIGGNSYFTTPVHVTLSGSDATSGVASSWYRLNGGAWTQYSAPFDVNNQGSTTIDYYSIDVSGISETPQTRTFLEDTSKPVTTASTSCPAGMGGSWCRGAVTVTLAATDATSGLQSTSYRVNGGAVQTYSAPISVSAEGSTSIDYWSTDNAGNVEPTHTTTVQIDTQAPTTVASKTGTLGNNGWYTGDVTVTLSATDPAPGSGVASTLYKVNGGTQQTYASPFPVSAEGSNTVTYWSTDAAGNVESQKTLTFSIDKSNPVTTSGAAPAANGKNGWYTGVTVVYSVSCADSVSGCQRSEYSVDGGAWQPYDAANKPQSTQDGTHTFDSRSFDNAGREGDAARLTVKIDSTQPTTTLASSCTMGNAGWCVGPATLTATVTDPVSGAGAISYGTSSTGPWTPYDPANKPVVSANGQYTYWARGEDQAGNAALASNAFKIDVTGPNAVATVVSGTTGTNGWYVSSVVVALNANDNTATTESGTASVQYRTSPTAAFTTVAPGTQITLSANGATALELRGVDVAGNVGSSITVTYKIDTDMPTVSASFTTTPPASGWWSACPSPVLTGTDPTSGVAAMFYRLDGGVWVQYSGPIAAICQTGIHTMDAYAKDNAGNVGSTVTTTIKVDRNPPTCSETLVTGTPGQNGWYTSAATVRVDASDGAGESGLQGTWYTVTTDGTQTVVSQVITPGNTFSMSSQGTNVVTCQAKDVAGNTGNGPSLTVPIDTTVPTISISVAPLPIQTGWIHGCANATFSASDAVSGVANVFWKLDGGAFTTGAFPMVCAPGTHTVNAYSQDRAGLVSTTATATFKLDNDPPSCTVALTTQPNGLNGWYVSDPQFALGASDPAGGSGVSDLQYTIATGGQITKPWTSVAVTGATVTLTAEGSNVISCQSHDAAGWDSPILTASAKLDTVAPASTATPSGQMGQSGWYVTCPTVTLAATDATSGVNRIVYNVDGSVQVTYSAPFQVCGDGTHTVQYYAFDNAGNQETTRTLSLKVDTHAPTTTETSIVGVQGDNGWWQSSVSVTLACADGSGSGCATIFWQIDNAGWQSSSPGASSVVVSIVGDGTHTLSYYSVDVAGNRETTHVDPPYPIDTTVPHTASAYAGKVGGSGWYTGPVTVYLNATDATSGPRAVEYKLNRGPIVQVQGDHAVVPVSADGSYTIQYHAIDFAGNSEPWSAEESWRIDQTPPTSTPEISGNAGANGWWHTASVTLICFDDGSGCKTTHYRVNGGVWKTYAAPIALPEGHDTVEFYSDDVAGNVESTLTLHVDVDNTPPRTATPPVYLGPTATDSQNRLVIGPKTAIQLSASDSLSLVDVITYKINGVQQPALANGGSFYLSGPSGEYNISISALDRAGNAEAEFSIKQQFDSTPPATNITKPMANSVTVDDVIASFNVPPYVEAGPAHDPFNGVKDVTPATLMDFAIVARHVNVTVTATDNMVHVVKVEFYLDTDPTLGPATPRWTQTTGNAGTYYWPWDTSSETLGNHVIYVKSYDEVANNVTVTRNVKVVSVAPTADNTQTPPVSQNLATFVTKMNVCTPQNWESQATLLGQTIADCVVRAASDINASTSASAPPTQEGAAPSGSGGRPGQ